eukprot:TRINITY_DN3960_c1_g2_i2.p2 TRINITY_DN3960_c1_g2~~TRINITY_DN3960_c1_g2_i2.p2  ORF type:complete len:203 (-),score=25.93 TRINITY_DN3960_c1_g2_i2:370-978(-)
MYLLISLLLLTASLKVDCSNSKGGSKWYSPYNKYYPGYDNPPTTIDVTTDAENHFGFSAAQTNVDSDNKIDISVDSAAEVNPSISIAKTEVKVGQPKKCYQHCDKYCLEPYKKCVKYDEKYYCKGCVLYKHVCMPVKECIKPVCLDYHPHTYECIKPYCAEYKFREECKKECVKYDCYPTKICIKEDYIHPACKPICKPVCY